MFSGSKEHRFPDDAPEQFRKTFFGAAFVPPLDEAESKRLIQLERDLNAVMRGERRLGTEQIVQRFLLTKRLRKEIDGLASAAVNTEVMEGTQRYRQPFYPRAQFPLLNQYADQVRTEYGGEVQALKRKCNMAHEQRQQSDRLMQEALIGGHLRFMVLNHNTGELVEGRPDFWRSDAARSAWKGERVISDGAPRSAVILADDLDAYFGSEKTPPSNQSTTPENKTAWLSTQLGGFDQPMRSAEAYRKLARGWLSLTGGDGSEADLVLEGRRLNELHRKYHPKNNRRDKH